MKTSNKILLGIFLAIIFLTTIVQLMVLAKYKRREYTAFQRDKNLALTKISIPSVRFVSITGLGNCVLRNSDSIKLEVEDYNDGKLLYSVKNDTLIINGVVKEKNDNPAKQVPYNKLVNVYIPAAVQVRATYSIVHLVGSDTLSIPSYTVHVGNYSNLDLIVQRNANTVIGVRHQYFNQLHLSGESSNINLDRDAIVNDLHLQLFNSSIDDKGAVIKDLSMEADSYSSIKLTGKNIKALK
jgi:hypothetical protein